MKLKQMSDAVMVLAIERNKRRTSRKFLRLCLPVLGILLFLPKSDSETTKASSPTNGTSAPSGGTETTSQSDLPQIAIVVAVIAVIVLIGIAIAKGAEFCYERSSVRDDASDISEGTKEILKHHIQLMKERRLKSKSKPADKKVETTVKVLSKWGQLAKKGENEDDEDSASKLSGFTKSMQQIGANDGEPTVIVTIISDKTELESIDSKDSSTALITSEDGKQEVTSQKISTPSSGKRENSASMNGSLPQSAEAHTGQRETTKPTADTSQTTEKATKENIENISKTSKQVETSKIAPSTAATSNVTSPAKPNPTSSRKSAITVVKK